jgi:D-serine deaminase-like pyridoxal phosphate-dependent protein
MSATRVVEAEGKRITEVDTPALFVDLDAFERNVSRMASTITGAGIGWRPHTKGIKVPALAHRLLKAGAFGVTCAKVSEAEVMADAGIRDILVANQVLGDAKVRRFAALCLRADPIVAVDSLEGIAQLDRAAGDFGVRPRVLVEVDSGMGRCGTAPGQATVTMAHRVASSTNLRFSGLMAWEGHAAGIAEPEEKRVAVVEAIGKLVSSAELCRTSGLSVDIVSCSGTGTYMLAADQPGVTEIQAGGGVWGDVHYRDHFGVDHECALRVMTTVVSRPSDTYIVTDGGFKTLGSINAMAEPVGIPVHHVERFSLSAEHGNLRLNSPERTLRPGDRLEWIVGYSDATVFMHDELIGVRGGMVESTWRIEGRGKLR